MSRIITFVLLLGTFSSFSQIVNVPDAGFKWTMVNEIVADLDGDGILDDDVDTNNDGEIQVSEAEAVIGLEVPYMDLNVQSLEGIQSFINLELLNCAGNKIIDIDLTQNTNLIELRTSSNSIASLDLSENTNLIILVAAFNQLFSINITQNVNLENLYIGYNGISSIDLSQAPNLKIFECGECPLSNIDLSNNPELLELWVFNTFITSLDLSQNLNLTDLYCHHSFITTIDVSHLIDLDRFKIGNTNLSSVDLSQNSNLREFSAQETNLNSLDVSQNSLLGELLVSDNDLTYLNVANGNNTNLIQMWADGNPNLLCIQVDDVPYANSQLCDVGNDPGWCKDATATYAEQCTFGVAENTAERFVVYPNPASDLVHIESKNSEIKLIRIYSSEGKQVAQINAQTSIDISQLAAGLYFIEIHSEGQKQISKFIKN